MKAIVTGATKGIGKAVAIELAQNGYDIIACARNGKDLRDLKSELENFGIEVLAIEADMSKKDQVLHLIEKMVTFAPQVHVLVNNVGVFLPGSFLDETDEAFEQQLNVNLNAAYYLGKHIGRQMRSQTFGHIFNICSIASKMPVENAGSYSVTKAAMLSLNHVMRSELAPHHVKVTAIIPGSTYTASWEGTTLDQNKFVQPEDVAKAIGAILKLSDGANVDELVLKPLNF